MKKFILILGTIIGFLIFDQSAVMAQQPSENIKSIDNRDKLFGFMKSDFKAFNNNTYLNTTGELKQKMDSIIGRDLDEEKREWINDEKEFFEYDSRGNNTLWEVSWWDKNAGRWITEWKNEIEYDVYNNPVSMTGYGWDESMDEWLRYDKVEISYSSGLPYRYVEFEWEDGQWYAVFKEETVYDENENKILVNQFDWNANTNQWDKDSKGESTYDENGNEIVFVFFEWNQLWVEVFKDEYTYDALGNMTMEIYYEWHNNDWEEIDKSVYNYNDNNEVTLEIFYSWNGSQWDTTEKVEISYDEFGNRIEEISYYWDNNQYVKWNKTEYTCNNDYSAIELVLPLYFLEYGIHMEHMLIQEIGYYYDQNDSLWMEIDRYNYYYSETSVDGIWENSLIALKLFPNPFNSSTTIEYTINSPQTVTITFYNQFGKQVDVIEESQQKGLNRIEWTPKNLADGIYYYRIQAGEQVVGGKVVLINE